MYERYCKLRDSLNLRDADVAKKTGITPSTFSDWKKGKSTPNADKQRRIASVLGVSVEYLATGIGKEQTSNSGEKYYFSDDTAKVAQELFENKDLRILFDAARNARPEDLKMAADMLKRFKETNNEG